MTNFSWQTKCLVTVMTVVLGCGGLAGCDGNPHRTQLEGRLNTLNSESGTIRQSVSDQQSALEALRQRLARERAELAEYNAGVQSYMLQHKLAVAAIVAGVAGTVPWQSDNQQYSQDAKEVALAVTAVAVIWAAENMDEVTEVLGTLNEADAHVHSLQAEIDQTAAAIEQQQQTLQQSQNRLGELSQQTASVQGELSRL